MNTHHLQGLCLSRDCVMKLREYKPGIAELLDELDEIKKYEPVDIEIPERADRPYSYDP